MSKLAKKIAVAAFAALVVATVAVPPTAQAQTVAELQAQIAALLAQIQQLQAQLAGLTGGGGGGVAGIPAGFQFTQNLSQGSSGQDVMYLQMALNTYNNSPIAVSGAGSPGNETQFFGPITRAGVVAFQNKYAAEVLAPLGLSAGTGFFGPSSRTKMNALLAAAPAPPPPPPPGTPPPPPPAPGPTPPVVPPPAGNAVSVTLASDTPASATVADAGNANMTKFYLTAGSQEVAISTIWVTRYGLTANADLENIKILDANGVKVGSVGSLNTNSKAQITFTPTIKVAANSSRAFFIRAGIVNSTDGGKTVRLGIDSASDVSAGGATVQGSFPVRGNEFTTVLLTIGSVDFGEQGTTSDSKPEVGDTDVIVNNFRVEVGSEEDVTIDQITVEKKGSSSLSHTNNIELWDVTNNKTLGTVAAWSDGGKADWSGLNIVVPKGETRLYRVQLDVIGGVGLTVNADMVDGSDVLASVKGNKFGFFITPGRLSTWNGEGANNQTIKSGALTVSKDATTPATGNIAQASDQNLAVFDFLAEGEDIKITSLKFSFDLTTLTNGEITNVKIFDENGNILAGPKDLTDATDTTVNSFSQESTVTFTDTIILPVGNNPVTLKAKIATATSQDDAVQVAIADPDGDITVTGMTSNDSITAEPQNTKVEGNKQTVKAGALAARTLTDPAARNVSKGVQDFVFATVSLDAGDSGEDVKVTSLEVTDTPASSGKASNIDNTEIWADLTADDSARGDAYETLVGSAAQFDETTANTADKLAFTLDQTIVVKKGSTIKVAVLADVSADAVTDATHTMKISAATVTGSDTGNSITATFSGDGQAMTLKGSGVLTSSVDASEPASSIVLAGSTGQTVGAFRLAADAVEDLDLDQLKFSVTGSNRISTLHLYDGTTLLKSFPAGGSSPQAITVEIDDNTLLIPSNKNKVISVKADFFSTVNAASNSDVDIDVSLTSASTTGKASGSSVKDTATRSAKTHQYYLAYPKFTVNSSSPSGNLIPSSSHLLAVFDVTAMGSEDITFQNGDNNQLVMHISQSVSTSDGTEETFTLQDADGTKYDDSISAKAAEGNEATSQSVTFTFATNDLTIPAGQTKALYVYSDTTELDTDGDAIQLWLNDSSDQNLGFGIDGTSDTYRRATIIFRPDIYAGSLVNP